jgi:uncharacterized membrane protein
MSHTVTPKDQLRILNFLPVPVELFFVVFVSHLVGLTSGSDDSSFVSQSLWTMRVGSALGIIAIILLARKSVPLYRHHRDKLLGVSIIFLALGFAFFAAQLIYAFSS